MTNNTANAVETDDNPIIFYCKDCEEIVETRKVGGKYVYTCVKCGTKNVAFGTKKSIYGFFKIVEEKEKPTGKQKVQVENNDKAQEPADGQVEVEPDAN